MRRQPSGPRVLHFFWVACLFAPPTVRLWLDFSEEPGQGDPAPSMVELSTGMSGVTSSECVTRLPHCHNPEWNRLPSVADQAQADITCRHSPELLRQRENHRVPAGVDLGCGKSLTRNIAIHRLIVGDQVDHRAAPELACQGATRHPREHHALSLGL